MRVITPISDKVQKIQYVSTANVLKKAEITHDEAVQTVLQHGYGGSNGYELTTSSVGWS